MEFKDYYKILGVEKTANDAEIKKAYRKLARKYHPDVSKLADAEVRMKEINEAREVLSDVEKRAAYDALGNRYQAGQDFNPPPGWDAGFEFSGNGAPDGRGRSNRAPEDFSDFFASIFGNAQHGGRGSRGAQSPQMRGEDHHAKVEIDLADAYMGTTRMITLRAARLDEAGHVVNDERTLNVKIPKGVKSGQHIRLAGQGSAGFGGGAAGDLFLEINFRANAKYRVGFGMGGSDVTETVPITPWEAMLGATIELDTPSGKVEVKVPPKSQTGRKLRLKNRGIPSDPPGDLYLELTIVLPPAETDKARELYETMAREMAFNPRHDLQQAQPTAQPATEK